jgi:hypothetical protein
MILDRRPKTLMLALSMLPAIGCHSGLSGTYTDKMGAVVLELRSSGKARFTFSGDVQDCAYTNDKDRLSLTCKGEASPTLFMFHDDGSLTGPPGSFMPPLRKER